TSAPISVCGKTTPACMGLGGLRALRSRLSRARRSWPTRGRGGTTGTSWGPWWSHRSRGSGGPGRGRAHRSGRRRSHRPRRRRAARWPWPDRGWPTRPRWGRAGRPRRGRAGGARRPGGASRCGRLCDRELAFEAGPPVARLLVALLYRALLGLVQLLLLAVAWSVARPATRVAPANGAAKGSPVAVFQSRSTRPAVGRTMGCGGPIRVAARSSGTFAEMAATPSYALPRASLATTG